MWDKIFLGSETSSNLKYEKKSMVRAVCREAEGKVPSRERPIRPAEKQPSYIGGFRVDKAAGYVGGKGFARGEGATGGGGRMYSRVGVARVLH